MFTGPGLTLAAIVAAAGGGCQSKPAPPPPESTRPPIRVDEAMQRREWDKSAAIYANGDTIAGVNRYPLRAPENTVDDQSGAANALLDLGATFVQTVALPFTYLFVPPGAAQVYSSQRVPPTFTAVDPVGVIGVPPRKGPRPPTPGARGEEYGPHNDETGFPSSYGPLGEPGPAATPSVPGAETEAAEPMTPAETPAPADDAAAPEVLPSDAATVPDAPPADAVAPPETELMPDATPAPDAEPAPEPTADAPPASPDSVPAPDDAVPADPEATPETLPPAAPAEPLDNK